MSNQQNDIFEETKQEAIKEEEKTPLTKKFRKQLNSLAKDILEIITNTSLASNSGTPYMDNIMESLQELIWKIKTIKKKYK